VSTDFGLCAFVWMSLALLDMREGLASRARRKNIEAMFFRGLFWARDYI
jgi:hypothetical protein